MPAPQRKQGGSTRQVKARKRRFDAGTPDRPVPFGKYRLVGRIARGGMAEIYRGLPAAGIPARLLAVKCMRGHLVRESRFVEMFIREGKLAMLLEHPGIVRTFDVGTVDGRYFIAMDYIPGKDLNAVLRRCQETGRRLPVPHALYVGAQVCEALEYAHTLRNARGEPLGVVNRDVSPSNVRVTYGGEVQLLDFGIAQAVLQASSEIGILKGKFSYMSPEQVRGLPVDRRSDVFSTGIVLHEMLACERLFKDESEFVLMEKVRRVDVKPPSAFNRRVPPEIDAIVMRALARDPHDRYVSAAEMGAELSALLEAYQFQPVELGELVRSLYSADFAEEQQIAAQCLSMPAPPTAGEREAQPEKKSRRKRGRRPRRRRPAKARRNVVLWISAIALLVAALIIFTVALGACAAPGGPGSGAAVRAPVGSPQALPAASRG